MELAEAVYEDGVAIKDVAVHVGRTRIGAYKALARLRDRLAACVRAKLGDIDGKGGLL